MAAAARGIFTLTYAPHFRAICHTSLCHKRRRGGCCVPDGRDIPAIFLRSIDRSNLNEPLHEPRRIHLSLWHLRISLLYYHRVSSGRPIGTKEAAAAKNPTAAAAAEVAGESVPPSGKRLNTARPCFTFGTSLGRDPSLFSGLARRSAFKERPAEIWRQ